ncbi:MAG: TraX family protein [Sedimentibacter sp.]|uniref:TraX family protein n=1 Tax=Sedimentibacter sp. TaxID=1960295 RepID=UPI002980E4C3|nr:TraX family protein [Sedimentibacter sp.]MDW5298565.1 TraX family protein [Sedimentibacter sp.]
MNVLIIKMIALTSMIIDHYGAIFQSGIDIYRIIGRLAFPLYCFLLVEGYFHTKDIKKYAKRLFIFAIISEVPFDLAFYNKVGFIHQNIFFTLFIGLAAIYFIDNKEGKYNINKYLIMAFAGISSIILSVDYNIIGIIYILAFYFTRNYKKSIRISTVALIMLLANLSSHVLQQFSLLALPIICFYNGELGPKNKVIQTLFYVAYPLHLTLFYIINTYH